ncbi:MAG TPA: hypothetical protein VGN51_19695 [Acidimicrobiia bacterium]
MAYGVTADGERRYLSTMRFALTRTVVSMDLRDTDVGEFERIELAWEPDPPTLGGRLSDPYVMERGFTAGGGDIGLLDWSFTPIPPDVPR